MDINMWLSIWRRTHGGLGERRKMKRGYLVYLKDEAEGIGVVATSTKEAKNIEFASGRLDCEWEDLQVKEDSDMEVKEMPVGVII